MNPDRPENDLVARVEALEAWVAAKKYQQITAPLDEASKNSLGVPTGQGAGSTAKTQQITISATPQTITVPANPIGTIIVQIDGVRYELPYIATP